MISIEEVEASIKKIEDEILEAESQITAACGDAEALKYWREKVNQLREKESQLRETALLLLQRPGLYEKLSSLVEVLPTLTEAAHITIADAKRKRHVLHRTLSNFTCADCKQMHHRLGLEHDFYTAYSGARIRNIIQAEVVTINNFQWPTEGDDDDDDVLIDMAAYLQEHFCPEGVVVICVAGINWLSFSNRRKSLMLAGKTDFAFVARRHAPDWVTPCLRIGQGDLLNQLRPFMLGLAELRTAQQLEEDRGKGLAQAIGEHLVANSMLPVRTALGIDAPVLLTDGRKCYVAWTRAHDPIKVICTIIPDVAHAAGLMKHLLGTACASVNASWESGDDALGKCWPPLDPYEGSDLGWESYPGSDADELESNPKEEAEQDLGPGATTQA